jgi:nudix-type nucleoside diphosphatase (YffH/AdpP family)
VSKIPVIGPQKILFKGWNTLSLYQIEMQGADGGVQSHGREIVDHGHAAAILLLDRDEKRLTLVRQFRLAVHLNGDEGRVLEACAGLLDDGDSAETCARREAIEETGIAPYGLHHAFDVYASPGALTEKTSCFLGFYQQADRIGKGGGLAHEGEEIEIVEIGFADALPMIADGMIIDAKTVALIQHAALAGLLQV